MGCGSASSERHQEPSKIEPKQPVKEEKKIEAPAPQKEEKAPAAPQKEEKKTVELAKEENKQVTAPVIVKEEKKPEALAPPPKITDENKGNIGQVANTPVVTKKVPDVELVFPELAAGTVKDIFDKAGGQEPEIGSIERRLVEYLNIARLKPDFIEKLLDAEKQKEKNKGAHEQKVLEEAKEFVHKLNSTHILHYSPELSKVCKDHCADFVMCGVASHIGSDGKKLEDRLMKVGKFVGQVGENIPSGISDPAEIILRMVIDGTPGKEERKNMFNPAFKFFGVAVGKHKDKMLSVFDFAEQFTVHN